MDVNIFGQPNLEGVNGFYPSGGFGMAYIDSLSASPKFPHMSYGADIRSVRVFASNAAMAKATAASSSAITDFVLKPGNIQVNGLHSGSVYYFRLGLVDEANNLVQYYPGLNDLPAGCTQGPSFLCPFAALSF